VTLFWQQETLTLGTYSPFPFFRLPLTIPKQAAKSHWHIIGTSGSGKSFFLAHLFLQLHMNGFPVTLIDPHGDLASLILLHLVARGVYKNPRAYEDILFLDIPAAERAGRFLPFNILKQDEPDHTKAANFKEAMHRAFPELAIGAATFDTLLPRAIRVLTANNLPLTALEPFFIHEQFRERLLARFDDPMIGLYFKHAYEEMRKTEQISYAGSVLRRAALLSDLPVLYNSFTQPYNTLDFRRIMDSGKSMIINLALREEEASRLFGCLMTVGFEQAAKSRAAVLDAERALLPTHHLLIDEFHNFADQSGPTFARILSQCRKYGLYLGLAHQYWGQANEHLKEALQNAMIDIIFNLGRTDAEYAARMVSRVDPMHIKHEVKDEDAVERTHPTFTSLQEQWETFTQHLQDLQQRTFILKMRNRAARVGRTLDMHTPSLDPVELAEVRQEYLNRYFTSFAPQEPDQQETREDTPLQLPAADGVVYTRPKRRFRVIRPN
jgi:DNA helicase HerA-like ATPase